ncbi:MAG TPA: YjgN family protein [Herbaspirillum sp.]
MTSAYDSDAPASGPFDIPGSPIVDSSPFIFSGRGSEYFRIWIVNMLLSLVTLGIYSAWAKVRRNRYFYDNTKLAGSSFDYHGNPHAILKGRIIAVVMIGLYHFGPRIAPWVGVVMLLLLVAAWPWLIWKSLQFKLHNSSYRGIRFGMQGKVGTVYFVYLLLPVLSLIISLLVPFTHQRIKRFQHNASRFGATPFSFHATVGSFYLLYLKLTVAALACFIAISQVVGYYWVIIMGASYVVFAALYPLYLTLSQNLIWSNTRLGEHRFKSQMKWSRMTWIWFSNLVLIAVTLGLFMPFATIRSLRYRIESMTLLPASDLSEFIAASESSGSAVGEGMTDLFDFDLSL